MIPACNISCTNFSNSFLAFSLLRSPSFSAISLSHALKLTRSWIEISISLYHGWNLTQSWIQGNHLVLIISRFVFPLKSQFRNLCFLWSLNFTICVLWFVPLGYIGLWTGQYITTLNSEFVIQVENAILVRTPRFLWACGEGLR